jgi:ABC-2 type transport system permease protein
MASVGAALVHFFLQSIVLVLALIVFQYSVAWSYVPLLPVALFALLFFVAALGILLGSINVYLRDTAHFVELALIAWFFMTPIVYPYDVIAEKLGNKSWLYLLNPITDVVLTFQRAIYGHVVGLKTTNGVTTLTKILPQGVDQWWYLWHLGLVIAGSAVLFVLALHVFGRAEGNFAEEL